MGTTQIIVELRQLARDTNSFDNDISLKLLSSADTIENLAKCYSNLLEAADYLLDFCECGKFYCVHRDMLKAAVEAIKNDRSM